MEEKSLDPDSLIRLLCKLIGMLRGVKVLESIADEKCLSITFTVSSSESRLLLLFGAEASNVKLNTWVQFEPGSPEAQSNPDEALHYMYRMVQVEAEDLDLLNSFNFLGAHLAWRMFKLGIISGSDEKYFTKLFGAISRS